MSANGNSPQTPCIWPGCEKPGRYFTGRKLGFEVVRGYACNEHERLLSQENEGQIAVTPLLQEKVPSGAEIRRHRLTLGLTQAEFANEVGVETSSISHWERGKTKPNAISLQLLLRFMDLEKNGETGQ